MLVFGRSNDWNKEQRRAHGLLNAGYHNRTIFTYDQVLDRAKRILGETPSVKRMMRQEPDGEQKPATVGSPEI